MTAQYTAWLFGLAVGGAMVSFGMELGMLSRPRLRTRCGACGRLVWRAASVRAAGTPSAFERPVPKNLGVGKQGQGRTAGIFRDLRAIGICASDLSH